MYIASFLLAASKEHLTHLAHLVLSSSLVWACGVGPWPRSVVAAAVPPRGWYMFEYVGICMDMMGYVRICKDMSPISKDMSIYRDMSIRRDMSTYVRT